MARQSFVFQGVTVHLYDTKDGWRYYQSEDETLKIRCKGLSVEII